MLADPRVAAVAADYLEGLLEGFVAYDSGWRMTYINAAGERLLRRRRTEVLGKTWHEAFPHAVGNPVDEMYQRVMRHRAGESMEYYYPHYGRWMEISASPVRTGGIGVYFRDITERKSAEEALRRNERDLDDFFENAAVGLHWVGADGIILRANRAELELLGYAREEYVGRHIAEFHRDKVNIADILHCLGRGQTVHGREAQLICKDGSLKDVLISSSVLFEDGRFVRTRCFTRDITEMKKAERALRLADRRKDEFLATLAHELRNPLAPIHSALQLLRIADNHSATAQHAQEIMERQLGHLVRLVDDLMEVSRVSRGKIALQKEPVDLAEVVGSAVETSRPLIEAARHRLSVELPPEPLHVNADSVRLAQVLSNLLNNAAKYTPDGGEIVLSACREGDTALVRVRDNGRGLERGMLDKVFDMFAQGAAPTHTQGGLGIGLALARALVQMHGGSIAAQSDGPGKGSEFSVRIPAMAVRPPAPRSQAAWPLCGSKGPRRILVVDDNVDAANSLGLLLRQHGHDVQVVHDGLAGLAAARGFVPDMILLDLSMPGVDGLDVARRLRLDPRLTPVRLIAVTGLGQEDDRRRTSEAGFDEHLVKPVSAERLRDVLERF